MKYVVERATLVGYAGYVEYANGEKELVVCDKDDWSVMCRLMGKPSMLFPDMDLLADNIVNVAGKGGQYRKISMIKLLRQITDCGLKEAKTAIEAAIDRREGG